MMREFEVFVENEERKTLQDSGPPCEDKDTGEAEHESRAPQGGERVDWVCLVGYKKS